MTMKNAAITALAIVLFIVAIAIAFGPPLIRVGQHKEVHPCPPNCVAEQKTERPKPSKPILRPNPSPAAVAQTGGSALVTE